MLHHNNQLYPQNVQALMDSKFEFYLTGSRFFRTNQWHSDWDFFVTDREDVREFLKNLGFVPMDGNLAGYDDTTIVEVWTDSPDNFVNGKIVQIQLVNNAIFKSKVQNALLEKYGVMFPTDKSKAKDLWNLAVKVAEQFTS